MHNIIFPISQYCKVAGFFVVKQNTFLQIPYETSSIPINHYRGLMIKADNNKYT